MDRSGLVVKFSRFYFINPVRHNADMSKPKPEDPEQYERFLKDSEKLGCEDLDTLDDVMKPELLKRKPKPKNDS